MKQFFYLVLLANVVLAKKFNNSEYDFTSATKEKPSFRITGGTEAQPHSFPYQAGLIINFVNNNTFWCGGSLISDQFILTAAHCLKLAYSVTVILGAHNIQENESSQIRVQVFSHNFMIHEQWDSEANKNDIGLIKLPRAIQFNEYIRPINLPKSSDIHETFVGRLAIASGWGRVSDESTDLSPNLRYVNVTIISNGVCNSLYNVIQSSHICVSGAFGKSTCQGDSGGPLVSTDTYGFKVLVGITSFGVAIGCKKNYPPVFTRVTSYLNWIGAKTGHAEYGNNNNSTVSKNSSTVNSLDISLKIIFTVGVLISCILLQIINKA